MAIARMHPEDRNVIDDFLLAVATRRLSLRGQFLAHVVQRAVSGTADTNEQVVIVCSEDMNDGQDYGGIRVVNPSKIPAS